ncbi:type I-E CRISPR-associated protein Cse2/CasB [Pluralibacter gergoviae]|uniref:type I-E CRISPR-associated protein Cse2/CasB n=1 Tax=Pluralibacter gergoviae TaxID=61647 RepID=UPI00065198A7|nr:type I-E CRISPR-associated protein Cse2/CasB [Pluralibacter gergoviae]KMK09491.1 CRISPR-associated protein Cse2 [Pluralibacter gergoviae]
MISSKTDALIYLNKPECEKALSDWCEMLSERNVTNNNTKINGRAWRAELRRAEPPYGAMLCEAYNDLCRRLAAVIELKSIDKMALSLFACVAAHIKTNNTRHSFAAQLGEKLNDATPCVSKLRFERLLNARTPDDFCRLLIQAVRIRSKEGCNVLSLADSLFIWMREWEAREEHRPEPADPFARHRVRWTNEYLSTLR